MTQNRYYSSSAQPTSLVSPLGSTGNPVVGAVTGFPSSYPYTVLLDWETSSAEAISVLSAPTGSSGSYTLPCTRGIDGTTGQSHATGAVVIHGVTAEDFNEPQVHMAASAAVHGLAGTVVGTTDTQTLTNKTLTAPAISSPVFSGTFAVPEKIVSSFAGTPTIAAGAAAGTAPTVSVTGNDQRGLISVTTGTGSMATGAFATITFTANGGTWPNTPTIVLTPVITAGGALHARVSASSTSAFTVSIDNAAATSTAYSYNYICLA